MNHLYQISPCGDHAITIQFGDTIDISTHEKVMAFYKLLINADINGVRDIIPAYTTVTIVYDIMQVNKSASSSVYEFMKNKIEKILQQTKPEAEESKAIFEIPVCYHPSFGIDLHEMSAQKNISIEEIISRHTSTVYHVYMLGFLPGFAYMGTVDDLIATPRLSTPRTNIATGSVGIAGNQTGIYPLPSPGGWNIIGRTPLQMFDVLKKEPCLLQPGDKIKFVSISLETFNNQIQA